MLRPADNVMVETIGKARTGDVRKGPLAMYARVMLCAQIMLAAVPRYVRMQQWYGQNGRWTFGF